MTSPPLTQAQRDALDWLPPDGQYKRQEFRIIRDLRDLAAAGLASNRTDGMAVWQHFWRITPAGEALRKEIVGT